jgi:CARDB
LRLAKGLYATAVNIHNPNDGAVEIDKKVALTFPPKEERPGEIRPIARHVLQSDEALEVDCDDLKEEVFPNGFPDAYIKGFVVIRSTESLDITAVYTTADIETTGTPQPRIRHTSIDVENVTERQLALKKLPDLVPVNNSADPESPFCVTKVPATEPPTLVVTIRNQGSAFAGPSTTEVSFLRDGTSLLTSSKLTNVLTVGGDDVLEFIAPQGWITGTGFFPFKITADSGLAISESNETNNVANGVCKVVG